VRRAEVTPASHRSSRLSHQVRKRGRLDTLTPIWQPDSEPNAKETHEAAEDQPRARRVTCSSRKGRGESGHPAHGSV